MRPTSEFTHRVFVPNERLVMAERDDLSAVGEWLRCRDADTWSYEDYPRDGKVYGTNDQRAAAVLAAVSEHGMVGGRRAIELLDGTAPGDPPPTQQP